MGETTHRDVIFKDGEMPIDFIRDEGQRVLVIHDRDTRERDLLMATHISVRDMETLENNAPNVIGLITAKILKRGDALGWFEGGEPSGGVELSLPIDERKRLLFILPKDNKFSVSKCLRMLIKSLDEKLFTIYVITSDREFPGANVLHFDKDNPSRECDSYTGGAEFDACINYRIGHGGREHNIAMTCKAKMKVVYLHSDMSSLDPRGRYAKKYDYLFSVSHAINEVHKTLYREIIGFPEEKIIATPNIIQADKVRAMSNELIPKDDMVRLFSRKYTFITCGRLVKQKNHIMLIKAFSLLHKEFPDSSLIILGEGDFRGKLESYISSNGLGDNVYLEGFKDNPHNLVKRADCFVLSSKQEGQGLALIESLLVGTPSISVDIPTSNEILRGGEIGRLCANSSKGLYISMKDFILSSRPEFDIDDINRKSIREFQDAIMRGL